MGFFKKVFKGIKKHVKRIGKGIKKAFASFGKFMNKFGVLGQVAMFFIMPHIAGALMKGMGAVWSGIAGTAGTTAGVAGATATVAGTGLAGATGSGLLATASRAVGSLMNGAAGFVSKGINVFSNVTEGVTNFIGEFSKTAANKISSRLGFSKVPFADASSNFFGAGDSAWSRSKDVFNVRMDNLTASKDIIKDLDATATEIRVGTPTASQLKTGASMGLTSEQVAEGLVTPEQSLVELQGIDADYYTPEPTASQIKTGTNMGLTPEQVTEGLVTTEQSLAELQGIDANYSTDPKSLLEKTQDYMTTAWDGTTKALIDETTNIGSNTVKRTADAFAGAPSAAINQALATGVDKFISGTPEEVDSMGAIAQAQNFGSFEAETTQQMVPTANYQANMGAKPYGYNAVQDGYASFMRTA